MPLCLYTIPLRHTGGEEVQHKETYLFQHCRKMCYQLQTRLDMTVKSTVSPTWKLKHDSPAEPDTLLIKVYLLMVR